MMMSRMNMMNMAVLHDAETGENLENASGETCSESGDPGDLICVMIRVEIQRLQATKTELENRIAEEDSYLDGAESESERLLESTSLTDQNLPLHLDPASINSRSVGVSANFSTPEPMLARSVPPSNSNSKRSGSRGEGANSATSALSKLTTRLNFLKEWRSQITNELQHMDKSQGSGRGLEPRHSRQPNLDKAQASEVQYVQSPDIGGELDYCALPLNLYKGVRAEGQSPENPERHRKSDSLN